MFILFLLLIFLETLVTTQTCCHETTKNVMCTCNALQVFVFNDFKLVPRMLRRHPGVQHVVMRHQRDELFPDGGRTRPANHSFHGGHSMGPLSILGRTPQGSSITPWWEDTFYEEGTQALADTMTLVRQRIQRVEDHPYQAQVQANLAEETTAPSQFTTHAADVAYTWWDWVFQGCVPASAFVFFITLIQCCYSKHLIRSLRKDPGAALITSKPHTRAHTHTHLFVASDRPVINIDHEGQ